MKGKHKIIVSNRFIKYEFEIKRNITIIQGDSATGKTTLLNLLDAYITDSVSSGVEVICDVPLFVYHAITNINWETSLRLNEGSIVFIEEDYDFVKSKEFGKYVECSDSYFVIINRENLENLPYSVEEIYCIKESGKYATTKKVYNIFERIYSEKDFLGATEKRTDEINCVVTEDAKAGYQFWETMCKKRNKECISSSGKSNIVKYIRENQKKNLMVIVDGAAFGSQMRRLSNAIKNLYTGKCIVFMPESFEWVLLKANLVPDISDLPDILEHTYNYIDSKEYMSWERYFTALLLEESEGKYYQYNKNQINNYYIEDKSIKKVKKCFEVLEQL